MQYREKHYVKKEEFHRNKNIFTDQDVSIYSGFKSHAIKFLHSCLLFVCVSHDIKNHQTLLPQIANLLLYARTIL